MKWKKALRDKGLAPCTVNSKLVALNTFLLFAGWEDCRVKTFRVQKRVSQRKGRVLEKEEY